MMLPACFAACGYPPLAKSCCVAHRLFSDGFQKRIDVMVCLEGEELVYFMRRRSILFSAFGLKQSPDCPNHNDIAVRDSEINALIVI